MTNFFGGIGVDGILTPMGGSDIESTIQEATRLALLHQRALTFVFNEVTVVVAGDSDVELLMRDWRRGMNGYLGDNAVVGPQPKAELSSEELAKDAEVEAANQARYEEQNALSAARAKVRRDRVEARMVNAPEMEFSNEADWLTAKAVNEDDSYGAGILSFAERWARMMQLEMSEGKSLEEIWNTACDETDLEGMSGYSLSKATNLLIHTWVHGEELGRIKEEHRRNLPHFPMDES